MNDATHQTYEDPQVVEKYIEKNAGKLYAENIAQFITNLPGEKILDLGCGPGQFSYLFAEKGFQVTGLDYSSEMIKQAKRFKQVENKPQFVIGDMRKLPDYFAENTFDGVWASASLLHIRKKDISKVLDGIRFIAKEQASIFISLKSGSGTHLVEENVYAENKHREFTFWQKDEFAETVQKHEFELIEIGEREGRMFQGKPTDWLDYFLKNK